MSAEIDAIRRFYAALNGNDMQAVAALLDPRIVRIEPEGFPAAGTYRGIAQVREHVRGGRASWAEGSCEPEKFLEHEGRIAVYVHVRVRLEGSADWVDARIADGFVVRDGRIAEFRSFGERAEVLRWAGVEG